MIPEVRVHNSELIMSKARRENLITIQGLRPPITDGGRRRESLRSGITTGGRGRDERVGGRHLEGYWEGVGGTIEAEEQRMGKGMAKTTHIITKGLTLNPEAQYQNSPYHPQPFPSRFSHIVTAPIVHSPSYHVSATSEQPPLFQLPPVTQP